MNQYEAMFLFDPTFGNSFEKCEVEVRRLIERAQGEIIVCRKWDERRLAYRIKGRKRGVYVLVYFKAPADRIVGLEHDAKLSESILRVLVLRADYVTPETMEQQFSSQVEEPIKTDNEAGIVPMPEDGIKKALEGGVEGAPESDTEDTPQGDIKEAPDDRFDDIPDNNKLTAPESEPVATETVMADPEADEETQTKQ